MGADVLIATRLGLVGVQRKEVRDLVASVKGERLAKELGQMQHLDLAVLVVEGEPRWTADGQLLDDHVRWTRRQHHGTLLSIQAAGVWLATTRDQQGTVA